MNDVLDNVKKYRISVSEMLYLLYFVSMLWVKGIGLYDGQAIYKLILILALGCLTLKFCITSHTLREWGIILSIGMLSMIVFGISKEKGIIICTLTVLAMKDVSVKRLFKISMWTWGITMCTNVIYHLLNLEASGYKVHEKLGLGHIFRWDLGFSHPNVLHISYLVFCGFVIYNLNKKYNWKYALGLMIGNLFVFLYSVSYTGIIVVTLYLVMSLYVNMRERLSKIEYLLGGLVFPTAVLLSLLSPILLPANIFDILNKIFSNRLVLAEYYLVPENIKLFGNNLADITTHILTMDNAYVFSLVIYGIIFFCVIIVAYSLLIYTCINQKKKHELVLIICFLIAGITEPFLFNTSFKNLTLVFIGAMMFDDSWRKNKGEREWTIISKCNKVMVFECVKVDELQNKFAEVWERNKKRIALVSVMIGLAMSTCCVLNKEMPTAYIVPRIHVDIESDETWYINNVDEPEYQGMKIMDYKDAETRMQILKGNIITLEYVRACISTLFVVTFLTGVIYWLGMCIKGYLKK